MLCDYLITHYEKGEPIFLEELPGTSRDYVRLQMKRLTDEGFVERVYNGVYILAYTTILGTAGRMSIDKYIEKKYLMAGGEVSGYITGLQLANSYGFTTQNPSCYEICSNEATTKQRKLNVDGRTLIIYQPQFPVTSENRASLQFLDFMSSIDRYSELSGDALKKKLLSFVNAISPDFELVKKYLPSFSDRVYRNIYEGGLMGELV